MLGHSPEANFIRVLLLFLIVDQASDVLQYIWGRHWEGPIAPRVSPNKTWEGFIGGVVSPPSSGQRCGG